ncbi:hypothetical protein AA0312_2540 [Acetobacter tropicalis NRIC 0312]|jgi:hypothetical protein|uniref:Uncharacterized protein n=1 Tax=Acetobacter tropicalis TaxID=104102 RepID=A0A0C9LNP0_9PROT|nr:hypothetical protein [Acetobacter tropicalis]KXV50254.1 hypothetical protein AD944_05585 [Acetobacter tropicalis]KXV56227.1 hypothetical protein AD947_11745 [Acetobacter tropicalis]OUI85943.1 hypothetical protein HC62_07135 [Acetobacter tropicalis]GAL97295.1 hypothetical protein ATR1_067c0067 [Acetobacter tropicalis]GBR71824.1 hypothetical protein AA0312_2540 [Acetobacter tropicalis NRIC 0312]
MPLTLRLVCLIGIGVCTLLAFYAPHYHLTAEIVGGGMLLIALVATVILDETPPAPKKAKQEQA